MTLFARMADQHSHTHPFFDQCYKLLRVVRPFESTLSVSHFSASDVRGSPWGMLGLSFRGAGTSAMAASRLKQGWGHRVTPFRFI